MEISIVLPALNEEKAISRQIDSLPLEKLRKKGHTCEVLVVDGGSTDRTAELARQKGATVISSKKGYGRQFKKGFKRARGEIIATADSDLTYPVEIFPDLVGLLLKQKLDFISVNRFARSEKGAFRFLNRAGNHLLTFLTNLLFSTHLRDSQSGMWVFRKSILKKLHLTNQGMPFSEELKIEAFRKTRAVEVPGSYKKRVGQSKLKKFKDGFHNMMFLITKRLGLE